MGPPSWSWRSTRQGQADTVERKVEICTRAYRHSDAPRPDFPPEDIIFDPNILTIATGIEEHNPLRGQFYRGDAASSKRRCRAVKSQAASVTSRSRSGATTSSGRRCTRFSLYHAIQARDWTWASSTPECWPSMKRFPADLKELVEDAILNRASRCDGAAAGLCRHRQRRLRARSIDADEAWRSGSVEERSVARTDQRASRIMSKPTRKKHAKNMRSRCP